MSVIGARKSHRLGAAADTTEHERRSATRTSGLAPRHLPISVCPPLSIHSVGWIAVELECSGNLALLATSGSPLLLVTYSRCLLASHGDVRPYLGHLPVVKARRRAGRSTPNDRPKLNARRSAPRALPIVLVEVAGLNGELSPSPSALRAKARPRRFPWRVAGS